MKLVLADIREGLRDSAPLRAALGLALLLSALHVVMIVGLLAQ